MSFSKKMLLWYAENKRTLPWRNTSDPYKIWLSEIMLQQTRVAQGLPYYHLFLEHFPTVFDLAAASEKKVLKLWQGLGYYSRARNLHATAQIVTKKYGGTFPNNYEELLSLKGIGDYTASAIASISYNLPEPVVDGNVNRVLARYFGVMLPINSSKGSKYIKELAREVMDKDRIRDYNQAIMEFGSLQCLPQNPLCHRCPLKDSCVALQQQKTAEIPVKLKKAAVKNRYFNYLVIIDPQGHTLLKQRVGKGIWQNLYEFPLIEASGELPLKSLEKKLPKYLKSREPVIVRLATKEKIIHKLSHQHLHTRFWIVETEELPEPGVPIENLDEYPVPVLIADFIKTLKNSYF